MIHNILRQTQKIIVVLTISALAVVAATWVRSCTVYGMKNTHKVFFDKKIDGDAFTNAWKYQRVGVYMCYYNYLLGIVRYPGEKIDGDELRDFFPSWASDVIDMRDRGNDLHRTTNGFGWPFICLCYEIDYDAGFDVDEIRGGIALKFIDMNMGVDQWSHPVLPMRVLWLGYLGNVVIYAALFTLLRISERQVSRYLRIKRNLCAYCTYPLEKKMKQCPECGRPVPKLGPRLKC